MSIRELRRLTIILLCVLLGSLYGTLAHASEANSYSGKVVYFFSPTCSSCNDIDEYIKTLVGVEVIKYNITDKEDKNTFNFFCDEYNVPDDKRTVPLVFAGNKWIMGKEDISNVLLNNLDGTKNYEYPKIIKSNNYQNDVMLIYSRNLFAILLTGIINGVNPCSIAMIVFLITLVATKNKREVLLMSLSFIISKFLSSLLFGTILFKCLNYLNMGQMKLYLKVIMMLFICTLIIGNIVDYTNAKKGRFNKLKLQLPQKVRKFNQSLMKAIKKFDDSRILYIIVFLIGLLVSLTEFLCTGQIYLVHQIINN